MTERKTESLTLRLPERLQAEIERVATRRGASSSEVAREMLEHGARVERQIEAQELQRRYDAGPFDRSEGEIEIQARFRWYTRLERQQEHWGQEEWEAWEDAEEERRRRGQEP